MNAIAQCAPIRRPSHAERVADIAVQALHLETDTHPKPGLVSHVDRGAHHDMDAALLHRSADVLRPFYAALAAAGADAAPMQTLRNIGMAAEQAMLAATGGVNTHRGAIFGLGLLSAAAGLRDHAGCDMTLGEIVTAHWAADIVSAPAAHLTHGAAAMRRYGVGGARAEAAAGFPSVYRLGLPALRAGLRHGRSAEAARVYTCFTLVAALDDTNLLHRGGATGLAYAQKQAAGFLRAGGIHRDGWQRRAAHIHAGFVARNLSPGGAADLLAMTLFAHAMENS